MVVLCAVEWNPPDPTPHAWFSCRKSTNGHIYDREDFGHRSSYKVNYIFSSGNQQRLQLQAIRHKSIIDIVLLNSTGRAHDLLS
ncbi:uncharacterized protein H6S33_010848 [Morchella sextelata]|uniref:uncharacterized protein n=1 Tax=Morchella sextelata TaxID=1174677 RepID=UPI001D056C5C|nr:uncharacterized protein H6S33_010848 [Morchella sextelata]KAH0611583.1 hypothetical protein H6S33_010848 [Morchella sextelata]